MKKAMLSLFVLVVFAGFVGSSFAINKPAPKYDVYIGKVVSIDTANNTFVDKVTKTQQDKTFSATAAIIAKLKVDEEVKLLVTPGTDVVVKVRPILKHVVPAVTKK
jgi:hypothetical protein